MALELERHVGLNEPLTIRLLSDGRVVASRSFSPLDLVNNDQERAALDAAHEALERHDHAVALEQAERISGVLPLPDDHVRAEDHFMQAVRALWPDLISYGES